MRYTEEYLQSLEGKARERRKGARWVWHDTCLKNWHLKVQLEETAYWFLTVVFDEKGSVINYCLDEEAADDSHYEFSNEAAIRKQVYQTGDEGLLLDEILTRYISEHGRSALYSLIRPYVTAEYHFTSWDWDEDE